MSTKVIVRREPHSWVAQVTTPSPVRGRPPDTRIVTLGTRDLITALIRVEDLYDVPESQVEVRGTR